MIRHEWMEAISCWRGSFLAMGSPCEILVDTDDRDHARVLCELAHVEAARIEQKYSRYRDDSVLTMINRSHGSPVSVDEETAQLLGYAGQCHELSQGRFDISSGVLREVWRFDGSDRLPDAASVASTLTRVGWNRVSWHNPVITLPSGMELDFGGIGKEYAVDRCAMLCRQRRDTSLLINFGGDIYISGPRRDGKPWVIGIDDPHATGKPGASALRLHKGAVATSGDARRYLQKDGIRYCHILDPRTGWPVQDAPRSVTVVAQTCLEAGMLATFAMLQGADAEGFLREQGVTHKCIR